MGQPDNRSSGPPDIQNADDRTRKPARYRSSDECRAFAPLKTAFTLSNFSIYAWTQSRVTLPRRKLLTGAVVGCAISSEERVISCWSAVSTLADDSRTEPFPASGNTVVFASWARIEAANALNNNGKTLVPLAKKVNISLLTWIKISLFVFFYDKLFFKNSFSSWFIVLVFVTNHDTRLAICRWWSVVLRRSKKRTDPWRRRWIRRKKVAAISKIAVIIRLAESKTRVHVVKTACLIPEATISIVIGPRIGRESFILAMWFYARVKCVFETSILSDNFPPPSPPQMIKRNRNNKQRSITTQW